MYRAVHFLASFISFAHEITLSRANSTPLHRANSTPLSRANSTTNHEQANHFTN
jgi:hypothetical protein